MNAFLSADGNDQMLLANRRTIVAKPNAPRGVTMEMPAMRGGQAEEAGIFAGIHGASGQASIDLADAPMLASDDFLGDETAPEALPVAAPAMSLATVALIAASIVGVAYLVKRI